MMLKPIQLLTILNAVRVNEWWESKFGTFFAIIYATAILLEIPFSSLPSVIGFLLFALLPGACFVSLINDLTDIEEDKIVGKKNFFSDKSKKFGSFLIFICLFFGTVVCLFLSKLSLLFYLAAWLVFSFYSIPPIRLKNRGVFGVLADASGAYLFPQLFVVSILSDWFHKEINFVWITAVGVWSFCLGLRGIISHQLTDKHNDKKTQTKTFVQDYKNKSIRRFVLWLIFPLELIGLSIMILVTLNYFALILLVFYLILVFLGYHYAKIQFAVVNSSKNNRLLMNEYYCVYLPISFLIFGLFPLSNSYLVIILHLVLFARSIWRVITGISWTFYCYYFAVREFLLGY